VAEGQVDVGATVVGAGFSGLRILHELRRLGVRARVIEAGSDVGGTWYWNRYPGARTDSESWVYCYSFDEQLQQEWDWSARFPSQEEVFAYLRHVADRFDMRRDIRFDTRVAGAAYDEAANVWTVATDRGESWTCRWLIAASGFLSVAYEPPFEGLDRFEGESYMTARWPSQPVSFAGRRVGVVGTGATGVQVIPEVARVAEHVTVFQRTPTYVIPSRNHPLERWQRESIKAHYAEIWEQCRNQVFGMPIPRSYRTFAGTAPEERERILEAGWETGGFRFIFETFDDITFDAAANGAAAEFVRGKIRAIVKDPATAELLCPSDHPIGAKRIPLGHHYYEAYNRPNVTLVSVRENPIAQITPRGVRLGDGTVVELDMLIFAVGFDVATGAMTGMNVRGRDGRSLTEDWASGPRSYLGICAEGYPNMFMMAGPHCPLVNVPVMADRQAVWIGRAISGLREGGFDRMEPTTEAVDGWMTYLQELLQATLLVDAAAVRSYYLGANIPGKALGPLFFFGGASRYFREIAGVADRGFEGFALGAPARVGAAE
jgi:cation diffusion facilitator CzcD-associated flavoprotein CzcO